MKRYQFHKPKYHGHIPTEYRMELIRLHLEEAKKSLLQLPVPITSWFGNSHLEVIGILSNNSTGWTIYRAWCKVNEIPSYKPII